MSKCIHAGVRSTHTTEQSINLKNVQEQLLPWTPASGEGKEQEREGMDRGKMMYCTGERTTRGMSQMFNTSLYYNAQKLLTILAGFVFVV